MGVFKTRQFSGTIPPVPEILIWERVVMGRGDAVERSLKNDILKEVIGNSYVGGL